MIDHPNTDTRPARRRASFAGWEKILGLDGSVQPEFAVSADEESYAIEYLRVSTQRQLNTAIDLEADGNSIATQREHCDQRAKTLRVPVRERFIEPGNSAQSIAKRPVFREVLQYLEEHPEVRYVIIYMRSRVFRNATEAAIVKRILLNMGVKLVSAKEEFGEGYMADAMEAITDIMNEVQVRQSGEDIRNKMLHKVERGGSVGRAKLGYINDRKDFDGRLVNTISLDEERAPLIRWAFEEYAKGEHSVWQLASVLEDLGLTTRASHKRPSRPIAPNVLAKILRDPYYTGKIRFKGAIYQGRHEPLIDEETFLACQEILDRRNRRGDRDFIHFHYLKGQLYCGLCEAQGRTRRLVYTQNTGHGGTYEYWVCSGKQREGCRLGTLRMEDVEAAVAREVALQQLSAEAIESMRIELQQALDQQQASAREAKKALRAELRKLEDQEERLIELAADGTLDSAKLRDKLARVTLKKGAVTEKLGRSEERLILGSEIVLTHLDLLSDPARLYRTSPDNARRDIIGGLFDGLTVYLEEDTPGGVAVKGDRSVPNTALHNLHAARTSATAVYTSKRKRASRAIAEGSLTPTPTEVNLSKGLNILELVGMTGFEPATP
jgi:site-specific DNA recombinase